MIEFFKKVSKYLVYVMAGVAMLFAVLSEMLLVTSTSAYTTGTSYTTLIVVVGLISVVLFGLMSKLLIFISYRISKSLFLRKSGMLYPFPILFHEFQAVVYAFLICGLFVCGVVHLPALFLPSLARILSAVRTLVLWGTLVLIVRYFLKHYAHDYDKKSLAYSLIILPLIFLVVSLVLTLVEVLR